MLQKDLRSNENVYNTQSQQQPRSPVYLWIPVLTYVYLTIGLKLGHLVRTFHTFVMHARREATNFNAISCWFSDHPLRADDQFRLRNI